MISDVLFRTIRAICLGGLLVFISPALLRAQEAWNPSYYVAYTTADPVDPDRLGLATHTGRYAVRVWSGCPVAFEPGQAVTVGGIGSLDSFDVYDGVGNVMIGTDTTSCALTEAILMDSTPCFTDADGVCDVNLEGF